METSTLGLSTGRESRGRRPGTKDTMKEKKREGRERSKGERVGLGDNT